MDKIARRLGMAERKVARRAARRARTNRAKAKANSLPQLLQNHREVMLDLVKARKTRQEDWELGPLAPKRNVPTVLDHNPVQTHLHWGTISINRAMEQIRIRALDLADRCKWAGGAERLCLAKGDRVVITEGTHKGKIDTIVGIEKEHGIVRLKNLKVNVTVPYHFVNFGGMQEASAVPERISIGSVRLVHPIKNEETGITKDMIINEIKPIKVVADKVTRSQTWSRLVPGLNVTLPWPKVVKGVKEELACDTPRIHVEQVTFIPTLLRPPMPETVIDELRNKYSKFRTRHTPEYIAAKEAEEAEKQVLKQKVREMLTPVNELNRLEREKRRARGQPVLSEEMLAKIGDFMSKNMPGKKVKQVSIPAEIKAPGEVQPQA